MRAVAIERFGGPEELREMEVDDPPVGLDSVLVRVGAAGVNPVDTKARAGRLANGWRHVFPVIVGWDVAGTVEQVGPSVTRFSPGDAVLSYCRKDYMGDGSYAELIVLQERDVCDAGGLPVDQAAALPLAGLTAYQCLHDAIGVQPGETVAVRAASGGVGSFAVQLARLAGAHVIGIASAGSESFVRELGASEFVDYTAGDPVDGLLALAPDGVDALVDIRGEGLGDFARAIRPGGRAASVLAHHAPEELGARDIAFRYVFVRHNAEQLDRLVGLCESGELRSVVHQAFPLEQASEAHALLERGSGVHGKLVLTV